MVKPVKFAHVVYMTRRYEQMIAWYRDVFEAEVVYENPALAFLTYDDEHHRFAFANPYVLRPGGKSPDDRGEIGVNHVAYTYGNVGDLLDTYKRLKRAGIDPIGPSIMERRCHSIMRTRTATGWNSRWTAERCSRRQR